MIIRYLTTFLGSGPKLLGSPKVFSTITWSCTGLGEILLLDITDEKNTTCLDGGRGGEMLSVD